ncbi:MAG: ABC transporter permease, partial [Paracoccaceae bacterium]
MTQNPDTYSAAGEVGAVLEKRTFWTRLKLDLKKSPWSARFGMVIIFIYAMLAIFAPVFAPYGEAQVFPTPYAPWSSEFIFGTDQIGRDIFSRLIYGARNTVGIAVATTLLAFLIGGAFGLIAAINRSYIDQVLSRLVDVFMAIPSLIFA